MCINEWGRSRGLAFSKGALMIVERESWMQAQYGCVRFRPRWEAIKIKCASRILDALGQRLKLLSLERDG